MVLLNNPYGFLDKKNPKKSGLLEGVDPVGLRESPDPMETKKPRINSRLNVGVEGFEPPTLCL